MSFMQLVRILWARRGLVLFVTLAAFASAVAANIILPKKYIAVAAVVVDSRGVDPVTGTNTPTQSTAGVLATQVDVISSRAVALKVVDALEPASLEREKRARALLRALTVKPSQEGNVIQIRFEDIDPVFAARAANAFADAYLQTNIDLKLDPARQQSHWFDAQVQSLRTSVEASREKLSEYQKSHGIVATEDKFDVEMARLDEIARQLVEAQRSSQGADARINQADRALESGSIQEMPDVLSNNVVQNLKAELARAEARLAELGERYDRNYPPYMSAAAEVNTLRERLAAEIKDTHNSLGQSAEIARRQVGDLQSAFDRQKARILELRQQRNEAATREREVENAQGAYDAAVQRAARLRLESQLNQTNVAVLDRAGVPLSAATPGLALSAALALVFGAMLGVALALMLERADRRVRSGDELMELANLEVLAQVPRLRASFRPQLGRRIPRIGNLGDLPST
jgi:succinoglycan biosynthesis transport protein ExoP